MRIKTTAGGIYDGEGKEIPIGTELNLADPETGDDGVERPHAWAGRFEVLSGAQDGKTAVTNIEGAPPVGPFEAKEKSPGWYAIHDGSGAEVGKALRKDDADAFNGLSDDDKAAFAADHAGA